MIMIPIEIVNHPHFICRSKVSKSSKLDCGLIGFEPNRTYISDSTFYNDDHICLETGESHKF
ncbi:uncharacterized protein CANTADRAFT_27376 [Suhomyces tanzawaensis NRRL Y-17324]|uniref:Uncharacterized protein n=1 Tax=Suhomyces tanzawaensis NRRL Y-17324 TaxID=984487 RepID=A0A1E4SDX0_9ASCO|nr:uncharacterized protein CANTADRAFT_27376 [Suhomyces tanzawaensis NRRL Y-17324]ODV77673.1 hypothetical protein CANTADRAFT_27376 [Suhomyces tanzawaensis NRRL Y-17324]